MALPAEPGISEAPQGIKRSCAACAAGGAPCPKCRGEDDIQMKPLAEQITPLVQRQETVTEEQEDAELVQAKPASGAGGALGTGADSAVAAPQGGGQPLPASERAFFEPRFGVDFGGVRIHQGSRAAEATRSIGARAYTLGRDVVFGRGEYRPESGAGKRLLAHELVHVVQQGNSVRARDPAKSRQRANAEISAGHQQGPL